VAKVYDDGRAVPVRAARDARHAEELAGQMRDRMTEGQCDEDWNYLPRVDTRADVALAKRTESAKAPRSTTVWLGRMSADYSTIESK
jgi:hypothetical protein